MAVDEKVDINVIGLGGAKKVKVAANTNLKEIREATGLDGTIRINGQSGAKEDETVTLRKGDMVSKEMPKVSHG